MFQVSLQGGQVHVSRNGLNSYTETYKKIIEVLKSNAMYVLTSWGSYFADIRNTMYNIKFTFHTAVSPKDNYTLSCYWSLPTKGYWVEEHF